MFVLLFPRPLMRSGVTQEEIDETRISTEKQMLRDLKELLAQGGNLEFTDRSNATPVSTRHSSLFTKREKSLARCCQQEVMLVAIGSRVMGC